jgi:hypothetical protein
VTSSPTIALQRTRSVSLRSGLKSDATYTFQVTPDPAMSKARAVTVFYLGKTLNSLGRRKGGDGRDERV